VFALKNVTERISSEEINTEVLQLELAVEQAKELQIPTSRYDHELKTIEIKLLVANIQNNNDKFCVPLENILLEGGTERYDSTPIYGLLANKERVFCKYKGRTTRRFNRTPLKDFTEERGMVPADILMTINKWKQELGVKVNDCTFTVYTPNYDHSIRYSDPLIVIEFATGQKYAIAEWEEFYDYKPSLGNIRINAIDHLRVFCREHPDGVGITAVISGIALLFGLVFAVPLLFY